MELSLEIPYLLVMWEDPIWLKISWRFNRRSFSGLLIRFATHENYALSDNLIVYPNHGAGSACGKKHE